MSYNWNTIKNSLKESQNILEDIKKNFSQVTTPNSDSKSSFRIRL